MVDEHFGTLLKRERETRSISLDEVARATKIRRPMLEALEAARADELPPEIIIKSFIHAYAKYLGISPEDVLSRYAAWKEDVHRGHQLSVPRRRRGVPATYLIAGLLGVAVLVFFFVTLVQTDKTGVVSEGEVRETKDMTPREVVENVTRVPVISESPQDEPSPSLPPPRPPVAVPPASDSTGSSTPAPDVTHVLVIEASERAWIQTQEGSDDPHDFTLYPGDTYTQTSTEPLRVTVGNAGGVRIKFDGKDLGSLGETGQVVRLVLPPVDSRGDHSH
jgi:cytoskeleton protein RodZ